ncbi:hypothetical protein JHK87_027424 [Glycine soja]|nr:hypothetical protein JHK87_027424 [Glycine soja]
MLSMILCVDVVTWQRKNLRVTEYREKFELLSKAATSNPKHAGLNQRELHFVFFRKPNSFQQSKRAGHVSDVHFEKTGGDVPWFEMLGIFSLSVCAACKCKFGRTGDGSIKVEWIPLEGVSSGELKLKIEAIKVEDQEGSRGSTNGWIELVVIEARDLIVADLRGTSDPYVRNPLHCRKTHIVLAGTHRTPYTAGKPTLSSLEPTEPPTQPENPYCRRSNPTEPTLSWLEENPTYTVATRVLKHSSVLKGQSFLREVRR